MKIEKWFSGPRVVLQTEDAAIPAQHPRFPSPLTPIAAAVPVSASMADSSQTLTDLSSVVAENVRKIDEFLQVSNLPALSLGVDGSARFPVGQENVTIHDARRAAMKACKEIHDLLWTPEERMLAQFTPVRRRLSFAQPPLSSLLVPEHCVVLRYAALTGNAPIRYPGGNSSERVCFL